ncbi:hypothetical protein DN402_31845 [Streptomyces sp. SW4]|nr:hypothetical protein DN402_31845 [Streptomyces sp. SW4]
MTGADWVWGGLLTAGAAFEVWALRNATSGDTLSESTRRWFRVHTRAGAVVFAGLWTGFAVWFLAHILG